MWRIFLPLRPNGLLEAKAHGQVVLSDQHRQFYRSELDRMLVLIEEGALNPAAATGMEMEMANIDAELHLAQEDLRIVRQELERRAE